MTERTFNPSSPACEQWEALLTDALDGLLKPEDEAVFIAHRAVCPACAALYEEARRGREWLEFLSPEPEAPAGLLDKILAQTGPGRTAREERALPIATPVDRVPAVPAWQQPGFLGYLRRFAEPRLMMTAAMAFFSITMTLSMSGVRLASLRPSAVLSLPGMARSFMERRLTMASTPIVRYYDNSRLVYEVQAKVRELRQGQEQEEENRRRLQEPVPGESKQSPQRRNHIPWTASPQQTTNLAMGAAANGAGLRETALIVQQQSAPSAIKTCGAMHSGGSMQENQERNTEWTA
jgi:anti-sigma factor RsiW